MVDCLYWDMSTAERAAYANATRAEHAAPTPRRQTDNDDPTSAAIPEETTMSEPAHFMISAHGDDFTQVALFNQMLIRDGILPADPAFLLRPIATGGSGKTWGGVRPTVSLYGGAYEDFDLAGVLGLAAKIPWKDPHLVQFFVRDSIGALWMLWDWHVLVLNQETREDGVALLDRIAALVGFEYGDFDGYLTVWNHEQQCVSLGVSREWARPFVNNS